MYYKNFINSLATNSWTCVVTSIIITIILRIAIQQTIVHADEFEDLLKAEWSTIAEKVSQSEVQASKDFVPFINHIYEEVQKILSTTKSQNEKVQAMLNLAQEITPPNIIPNSSSEIIDPNSPRCQFLVTLSDALSNVEDTNVKCHLVTAIHTYHILSIMSLIDDHKLACEVYAETMAIIISLQK